MNQLDYSAFELSEDAKALLKTWQVASANLTECKRREMELREQIVQTFVPEPKEGLNKVEGAGFTIKVTQPMNVKIDAAALSNVMKAMPKEFQVAGVLVNWKPSVVQSGYDVLPEDAKKIFDQTLTITPGTAQLTVTLTEEPAQNVERLTKEEIADVKRNVTEEAKRAQKQALCDELKSTAYKLRALNKEPKAKKAK